MAVLSGAQVARVYTNDAADRTALYRVSNVSGGDTVDLGPSGAITDYQAVKRAVFVATTANAAAAAAVAGTVITFPAALNGDAGYLLVWGNTA
jgi:hypothetical protein